MGRSRDEGIGGRGDDGHAPTDNVRHQCRQPLEFALQPVVLDRYISVLDIASFAEAIAERCHSALRGSGRPSVDKRYCWRRVLCARTKCPRRRVTDPSDELAPDATVASPGLRNHLIGAHTLRRWHREAERLRGL